MNQRTRMILLAVLAVIALVILWRRCNPPVVVDDGNRGPDTPGIVEPEVEEPDTGQGGGAPYPPIPEAGEKTDMGTTPTPAWDRPCVYASDDPSVAKFHLIVIAIPHQTARKWTLATGSPTVVGGNTLQYTFTETTMAVAQGMSVYVDNTRTLSSTGITTIKVVATLAGGGSDDNTTTTSTSDDDAPGQAWTSGIPLLWHKRIDGTTVKCGGFIYGLPNGTPTLKPLAFGAPSGSNPIVRNITTTSAAAKLYYPIAEVTISDNTPTTMQNYRSPMILTPGNNRSFWFQD